MFVSLQTDLIVKRFGISYATSGKLGIIPYGCAILSLIIWSLLIKKYPSKRRNIFISMPTLVLIAHIMLFFIPNTTDPHV
jgi:sugar phosphate permease